MDQLIKQVRKARRRLIVQQFLTALVWCWFATLLVAAAAIVVQKWLLVNVDGLHWAGYWLGGAISAGLLVAIIWTWVVRSMDLETALEIDRRFGLKERVSSALALTPEELQTPFGQALVEDARRRIGKLEVEGRFPITLSRRAWLPVVPAAIAFAFCFLADPTRPTQADANANTVKVRKQIDESVKPLQSKLQERAKQAGEEGLKDAADLFKKIEEGTRDLAKKDESDRHEAMTKLNDLAQQLEQRREKLSEGEKLKDQLAGMKNLPNGPGDKLAKELKNGNFDKALKEIEKLQAQLSQGQLDPQKQKELAEQLNSMKDALDKIADAQQKLKEELEKKLEQANKAGDQEAAKKLEKQLQAMANKQPQMDQLRNMAGKLGQAGKAMQQGNQGQAQAALGQLAHDLAQTQQELAEMQMLETTLDEIDDAKAAMNCSNCGGVGCELCRKGGNGFADRGRAQGAEGQRPEAAQDTKFYDSKVKQEIGKGAAVITGLIASPNAKGQVVEEIKNQVEAAKHDSADPLTGQRLPRQERDHVQQYFDAFRKGE
ncbi:MAG TPA: hypothetical protein VGJ04_04215 [Pirellulales bacterium]